MTVSMLPPHGPPPPGLPLGAGHAAPTSWLLDCVGFCKLETGLCKPGCGSDSGGGEPVALELDKAGGAGVRQAWVCVRPSAPPGTLAAAHRLPGRLSRRRAHKKLGPLQGLPAAVCRAGRSSAPRQSCSCTTWQLTVSKCWRSCQQGN